jgi:hypothetical protein
VIGVRGYWNRIFVSGAGSARVLRAAVAAHPALRSSLPRLSLRRLRRA